MGAPKGMKPWNAGTSQGWIDKRGYKWLYVSENGKRVARREHRVLMEQHIGRRLEPWELVHHKDGNTQNNSIDNLELTEWGKQTAEHHKGGRKSEDAKRSMQAFALMREQLKREREIKFDLLEALNLLISPHGGTIATHADNELAIKARAAIAKATGEAA